MSATNDFLPDEQNIEPLLQELDVNIVELTKEKI